MPLLVGPFLHHMLKRLRNSKQISRVVRPYANITLGKCIPELRVIKLLDLQAPRYPTSSPATIAVTTIPVS
ncbi:hypothetical protein CR513_25981, partial [Mucuna pruriens]